MSNKRIIDSLVWWIPFRKLRNAFRDYLNLKLDMQRNIIHDKFYKRTVEYILSDNYINNILNSEKYKKDEKRLERFGYKVYSQNDEDGIINEIFNRIGTTNKFFVEFGVQDGLETNSHFLLFQGWKGVYIEGDNNYFDRIKNNFNKPILNGNLTLLKEFITAENINELLYKSGAYAIKDIDLLSIDIDGNDYHVFDAIDCVNPRVIVIEYNAKFPPPIEWVMPYNPNHIWDGSDNAGASLEAITKLANKKGYRLVATNLTGTNAFYVKKELCKDKFSEDDSAYNLYNPCRYGLKFSTAHPSRYFLDNFIGYGYKLTNILPSTNTINLLLSIANDIIENNNIKIVFEFGSRYGEDTCIFAKRLPKAIIYGFECNENTIDECRKRCSFYKNIVLTNKAISEVDGKVNFYPIDTHKTNIPHHIDGNAGASSMLRVSKNYKDEIYEQYETYIESVRLDTFMESNNIQTIDILWMDIQGMELSALKSLSNKIKNVKIIHTETEFIEEYDNQPLFNDIKKFLEENGFLYIGLTRQWKHHHGDALFVNKDYIKPIKFKNLLQDKIE